MSSLYHDRPLNLDGDYIRLLQVKVSDDTVDYDLISNICLKSTRPQYLALSYCWGDTGDTCNLKISGHELMVSSNLGRALQKVQYYYSCSSRFLAIWCDQICIDQSSVEERNHQVEYMSQIYTRAEEVLVWLPTTMSQDSMCFWESRPYEDEDGQWNNWLAWKEWHLTQIEAAPTSANSHDMLSAGDKLRTSLRLAEALANMRAIINSGWWQRAWIVQEFILASRATFLIQRMSVPWRELDEVLTSHYNHLSDNKTRNDEALRRYAQTSAMKEKNESKKSFSSNLNTIVAFCWSPFGRHARALKLSFISEESLGRS